MGAEVPARAAEAQPSGPRPPVARSGRAVEPQPSWARRKGLGASPPSHREETEARVVERCRFCGETLLHPGFLINDSFTSRDFFLI